MAPTDRVNFDNRAAAVACRLLAIVLMSGSGNATAEEDNSIRAGLSWSDNIARVLTNPTEDTIETIDLYLDQSFKAKAIEASLVGSAGYRHFVRDSYDDEVVADMTGALTISLLPDYLSWEIADQFVTVQLDPYRPDVPVNRDNLNHFSTGPDLRIPLTRETAVDLAGRYHDNDFRDSDADNEVIGGQVSLVKALASRDALSFNMNYDEVEYDPDSLNNDFDRAQVYVGLVRQGARGDLSLSAGGNRLTIENEDFDGFFGHLLLRRNLSSRSVFFLAYEQGYSDTSDASALQLQTPGGSAGNNVVNVVASADPFEGQSFAIGIDHDRNLSTWYAAASASRNDYVSETALDREWVEFQTGVGLEFGAGWGMGLDGSYRRGELTEGDQIDKDLVAIASLTKQLSRVLDVSLSYAYYKRDSSVEQNTFQENQIVLTFGFSPSLRTAGSADDSQVTDPLDP